MKPSSTRQLSFAFTIEPFIAFLRSFVKKSSLAVFLFILNTVAAQPNLTISNSGQTGTSGTNWTTSGTNPVTVSVTGTASINTSVITGYLNAGTSVVVNNTTVGTNINNNISKTAGAAASLTFKDIGCIRVGDNISINSTSNALNIILWADADNSQAGAVDDYIYCGPGSTFTSNGGKIVMAGGPDNGTNGGANGDGIPDGFPWNGSNSTTYGANTVGGLTLGPRTGSGTVVSLQSNGGEIILRGATSNNNNYPGITSQGNLKIESGTGKITLFGKSTTGHGIELTYGAVPAIAISSASTSSPAIDIKGTATIASYNGFWASNNTSGNILIQSTGATGGGVSIEGTNAAGLGVELGTPFTGISSQVLSQAGTIAIKGQGTTNYSFLIYGDAYIGNRKDATAVQGVVPVPTASSANILIQANDQYTLSPAIGRSTRISSTGALTVEAYSAGYTGTVSWTGNLTLGTSFSGITLGESAENYSIAVNNNLTAAGNITAYASDFTLADGVGLASSVAGNININANGSFNTLGSTRRTISTVNGNINIFADADASGNGTLDIDYTTFNPGTGNTTLRSETLSWVVLTNAAKPYINGTGTFKIEPADASFQNISTSAFVFDQDANGIAGLIIGKSTNTGNVTLETTALNIAGPIALYGGIVTLGSNLTSSATGDIFIKANTNNNGGAAILGNASILKTAGTGTLTIQSQARLNSGTVTASGTGVLNVVLWSDYGNNNNGGVEVRSITTNGGHVWVGGSSSANGSYTWNGLTVGDGPSVGSVNNNYNAIDFWGPVATSGGQVLIWGGNGYSSGTSGIGVMAAAAINSGAGNITLIADNIATNDITITSTGVLRLLPDGGSYPADITWSGVITSGNFNGSNTFDRININSIASLGGLVIGYYNGHLSGSTPVIQGNTSNITFGTATTVAGGVTLYGTGLTVNQNIGSSTGGNINLFGNTLSLAAAATLTSTGNLNIQPITSGTTIGLAGGAGTLAVSAANFSTNFGNGLGEIRIGNSTAGNITLNAAIAPKSNLRLTTGGNLLLNETLDIGTKDLRFIGNSIVPATGKFIKTNGTAKVIMDVANNATKLFPVGVSASTPVTITNRTGASDTFSVTASPNVYVNGGTSGTAVTFSPRVDLTWNISNTSASTGAGNVDIALEWDAANVVGSLTTPRLAYYDGAGWKQLPGVPTVDLSARTLIYSGYTGALSTPFIITQANISLPVTWLSFTGRKVETGIELNWTTVAEINNAYFEVERRTEGSEFSGIGKVNAKQNQGSVNEYRFVDYQPFNERSYYRLKQVDVDGRNSYSAIVTINVTGERAYKVTAIPGTKQLRVSIPQSGANVIDLLIYDGVGRRILRQQLQPGNSIINTGSLTADAVYFIKLVQQNKVVYSNRFINQ